jgi:ABC-type multidrug transport system ATPase subunit
MSMGLEIRDVTKSFGDKLAVDQLSVNVPRGSIYGFLGPNGAGKTTTIRMVMSILFPDSGSIRLFDCEEAMASKDRLGYLPEEKGLYKKMKARELIAYFGRLKGMPRLKANQQAIKIRIACMRTWPSMEEDSNFRPLRDHTSEVTVETWPTSVWACPRVSKSYTITERGVGDGGLRRSDI